MNKMILVSVKDKKVGFFHPPYCVHSKAVAIRGFGDAVMKPGSDLNSHPEDFTLFMVGEFNTDKGVVTPVDPVSICCGLDFAQEAEK